MLRVAMRIAVFAAVLALALAPAPAARALEVAGVDFPERIEANPGGHPLVLNGAGIRKAALFVDVYAAGLYLPKHVTTPEQAIDMPGPKRVAMELLRDVDSATFSNALVTGLRENHSEAQMASFAPQIEQLTRIMARLDIAKRGTRIVLDLVPGKGTSVSIDGAPQGDLIPGEDFYRALLRNWIGEQPVSKDLKAALLRGAASQ
jgi:hypothetical protein